MGLWRQTWIQIKLFLITVTLKKLHKLNDPWFPCS